MIQRIALTTLLGIPVVVYGGILTVLSFAFTAYIGFTNFKNKKNHLPFAWHTRMMIVAFSFALIHMFFALSIFLGY